MPLRPPTRSALKLVGRIAVVVGFGALASVALCGVPLGRAIAGFFILVPFTILALSSVFVAIWLEGRQWRPGGWDLALIVGWFGLIPGVVVAAWLASATGLF